MPHLQIRLLGKISIEADGQMLDGFSACKVQEILSYLLLYRDRPHSRETLAALLWGDCTTEKSKKYLRQALWHLQAAVEAHKNRGGSGIGLSVEHDWVQIDTHPTMWLDIAVLEQAYALVQGVPGRDLDPQQAASLQSAVEVYRGDLLEGWYQDWCLYGRELLQNKYLMILDKLIGHCLSHQQYETGQRYGALILRYDRARERTHRQLMRLLYMSGDRTGALRQYERCTLVLREDLGVRPDKRTQALYDEIRRDSLQEYVAPTAEVMTTGAAASLAEVVGRLKQLETILVSVRQRVMKDIKAIEMGLKTSKH